MHSLHSITWGKCALHSLLSVPTEFQFTLAQEAAHYAALNRELQNV